MLISPLTPRQLMAEHLVGAHASDPTVPDRPTRRRPPAPGRLSALRVATAAALRRVADGLAPAPQGDGRRA